MRSWRVLLFLALLELGGSTAHAQRTPAAGRAEAARLYLSQSLASLQRARTDAVQVAELGALPGFDLARYVAELDQIARGLERYLRPEGPAPGHAAPVAITGQYLLDGLRHSVPPARDDAGRRIDR